MSKIRIGVAGLGGISKRIHIPVLQSFPNVKIVAGAEKNESQRERVRGLFALPNVYETYQAMLEAMTGEPWFEGLFVWKYFSDPWDETQEVRTGFSPRGKEAEKILAHWFRKSWSTPEIDLWTD